MVILWMEEILHQFVDGQHPIIIPLLPVSYIVINSYNNLYRIFSSHSITCAIMNVISGATLRISLMLIKSLDFAWDPTFCLVIFGMGGLSESVVKKQKQFDGHFSEVL